jgi:hypothetical protein
LRKSAQPVLTKNPADFLLSDFAAGAAEWAASNLAGTVTRTSIAERAAAGGEVMSSRLT